MIALNDPARDPAGLEKEVRDFQTTRAKPEQREAVKLRLLLNQISAARNRPEEVKRLAGELNNFYLHYNFDAVNPFQTEFRNDLHNVEGGTPTATLSEQELKDITLEAALEKAYREISLSHLKPEYLEYVDLTRLDFQKNFSQVSQVIIQTPRINNIRNLIPTLQELMKQSQGVDFVRNQVWRKLSLEHKEALLTKDSPLGHFTDLWGDVVNVKYDLERQVASNADPKKLIATLEEVASFLKKMPARFVQYRRNINLKLLEEKVKAGEADKKTLLEYLKDPVASDYTILRPQYGNQLRDQRQKNKEDSSAGRANTDEGKVVRKALVQILWDAKDYKDFEDYLDPNTLAKIFYEQKLLKGEDAGEAKDFLSEGDLQKLFNEKRLQFSEANKRRFGKGERVSLGLEVKNVPRLTVRLFEVNTLNYVLEKGNLDFELIDTAGLIPSSEHEYRYSQSAMVLHPESFEFQNIQTTDQGVFILDFIGGEVKARAVVIKGQLNLIYDKAGGRTAVLLDQDGNVCKGDRTGVYIKGTFFAARGANGEIHIPSTVASSDCQVVAVHHGFATLSQLRLGEPNPSLQLNVLFNSETFQPGNNVTFVLEPKLLLYGRTADLSQLRKVNATVTTNNEQGVSNTTSFPNLNIQPGEDLTVSIIFPPKVRSVQIELTAEHGEKDNKKNLQASKNLQINADSPDNVQSILFQKQVGGNLKLQVVGRNGEPRRNQVVKISIGLKFLQELKSFTLVTNEQGVVELGSIKGIDSIEATSGAAFASYFPSEEVHVAYPPSIDLKEDEAVSLPFNAEFDSVVLSEVRGEAIVREFAQNDLKRTAGVLTLPALKEGSYRLEINKHVINLTVHKGDYIEGKHLLKTHDAIIALPGDKASWFQSKREDKDAWEIKLWAKSPSLKVRLLTFNYLPSELKELTESSSDWQKSEKSGLSESLSFPVRSQENVYSKQIFLGDELAYVYDRRSKKSFIGNTLEKPGVLLKRNRVGETTETEQVARQGESDRAFEKKESWKGAKPMMMQNYPAIATNERRLRL